MNNIKQEMLKLNSMSNYPILVVGTNGISKEVASILYEINDYHGRNVYRFLGYIGESTSDVGKDVGGDMCVCSDDTLSEFISSYGEIGIAIPLGTPSIKEKIKRKLTAFSNVRYPNIISPSAKIMRMDRVFLGEGNLICSGVVMTLDINIGSFNLFNLNTTVGHDTQIGDFCVINPLCAIAGFSTIEDRVLIGARSTVKEHTLLRANSTIGMGAIITKEVEEEAVMICDAAHKLR